MIGNRRTGIAVALLTTALLTAGCGTTDTGVKDAPPPTASTAAPASLETRSDHESRGSEDAATTGASQPEVPTGGVVDSDAATGVSVALPVPPDLEAKRWGGDDYDPELAAKMPEDPLYPGERTEVLGQTAVICAAGGFYGIHYIAAPDAESCGAAETAMAEAFANENAMGNVHFAEPRTVDVGDGRVARCVEKGNILFDCRDMQGAPVAWFW
ncbi:hypothetical protein M0E87_05765 [Corynebacterium sp. CCM 9185]|uniref:Secreted protein n=1 Tax=Corynebacterium marambiense TaxID=2765364 RepID=A0ABS0VUY1_9CORY|nr:hypothetical protein [Corynebacterium marambiense]MBI9000568.1 hypothetical protein [Corynebacterium marambiense]MCK7663169.1 hypothetical protein [Corynebacterium marambiense]MCX7542783.1 hypothetical protein [Corynebacterium marambiense]